MSESLILEIYYKFLKKIYLNRDIQSQNLEKYLWIIKLFANYWKRFINDKINYKFLLKIIKWSNLLQIIIKHLQLKRAIVDLF